MTKYWLTKYWLNKERRDIAILAHPLSLPTNSSLRRASWWWHIVTTLLEDTTDHTPSIKHQVTELVKVKLENQINLWFFNIWTGESNTIIRWLVCVVCTTRLYLVESMTVFDKKQKFRTLSLLLGIKEQKAGKQGCSYKVVGKGGHLYLRYTNGHLFPV